VSAPQRIRVRRKRQHLFAAVPHEIVRDGTLSDKAFRLWVVLQSYADWDDQSAYPSVRTLAQNCGCSRASVERAQRELSERGLLEIDSGKAAGETNVYTIVEPEGYVTHDAPPTSPVQQGGTSPVQHKQESRKRQPSTETSAPLAPALDDPIKLHAHKLAVLAFEQPVKPVTRGGFAAVMARIESELRAGTIEQHIRAAITAGDVTWTADGLRTAISKAKPRKSQHDPLRRSEAPTLGKRVARARELQDQRKRALPE
jgi:biotin operon repressor